MLKDKHIVVGVCGGIAIYKVVDMVSKLKKQGANVTVIMTESAKKFVTPLTFQAISQNKVYHDLFDEDGDAEIKHIILGQRTDMIIVAPASANMLGKVANGIADDMLSTTLIAATAPVLLVPAMNTAMYKNTIVAENLEKLVRHGYHHMVPDSGTMAMKAEGVGIGRLPEPAAIVERVINFFNEGE